MGRLARVDVLNRTQRMPEAVQLAHEVLRRAGGDALVTARVNALLATALFRLGAWAQSVPHAETAVRLLDDATPLPIRVDHALILALVASLRAGEPPIALYERADKPGPRARRPGHDRREPQQPGLTVTTSIGLTCSRPDDTVSAVLRRADEHLYAAKRGGRNRTVGDVRLTSVAFGGAREQ